MENRKKKILYVITKSNWGGAQRYIYDLATNLPKREFSATVVLGGNGELKERLEAANIRVIVVEKLERDIGILKDIASFFALLKIFKSERPDIVHLNSSKAGGLGALAGRLAGVKKIIFTAHGWAWNEEWRGTFSKFLIRFASWFTIVLSHTIIVLSQNDKIEGERTFSKREKFILIRNGIKKTKYASRASAHEALLGERASGLGKKLWIGTIAELHPNKGISYAIEGLEKLRQKTGFEDFIYIVIGEGEEREKLSALVKKLNMDDQVFFVGQKENAAQLLKAFDIFLLTSTKEGLPYVILEAGVAGIPVIATGVGGIPELVEDMRSGILVKPRRPEEIALALEFLTTQKEKRLEFADSFENKTLNNYSIQSMINATVNTYNL